MPSVSPAVHGFPCEFRLFRHSSNIKFGVAVGAFQPLCADVKLHRNSGIFAQVLLTRSIIFLFVNFGAFINHSVLVINCHLVFDVIYHACR